MKDKLSVIKNSCTIKALAVAIGLTLSTGVFAATQTVTFEVTAINEISVSGTPSLTVNAAVAGSAPTAVTDTASTWAVTTNDNSVNGMKVTVAIDLAMPSGVTLTANLTAPAGASSAGALTLATTAVDSVTGIKLLNESSLGITYQLSATAAAGVVASASRTVTYTIVAG